MGSKSRVFGVYWSRKVGLMVISVEDLGVEGRRKWCLTAGHDAIEKRWCKMDEVIS